MNDNLWVYMTLGWAVFCGAYAFRRWARGEARFAKLWFEVFSGGVGAVVGLGAVMMLFSMHSVIALTLFWGIVAIVVGGGWWMNRKR